MEALYSIHYGWRWGHNFLTKRGSFLLLLSFCVSAITKYRLPVFSSLFFCIVCTTAQSTTTYVCKLSTNTDVTFFQSLTFLHCIIAFTRAIPGTIHDHFLLSFLSSLEWLSEIFIPFTDDPLLPSDKLWEFIRVFIQFMVWQSWPLVSQVIQPKT